MKRPCHTWGTHKQAGWSFYHGISCSEHLEGASAGNTYCRKSRWKVSPQCGWACELPSDVPRRAEEENRGLSSLQAFLSLRHYLLYPSCLLSIEECPIKQNYSTHVLSAALLRSGHLRNRLIHVSCHPGTIVLMTHSQLVLQSHGGSANNTARSEAVTISPSKRAHEFGALLPQQFAMTWVYKGQTEPANLEISC